MSRTHIHKYEGKCRSGVSNYENAPNNLKRKWSRHNFEVGYFRNLRNQIISKTHLKLNEL